MTFRFNSASSSEYRFCSFFRQILVIYIFILILPLPTVVAEVNSEEGTLSAWTGRNNIEHNKKVFEKIIVVGKGDTTPIRERQNRSSNVRLLGGNLPERCSTTNARTQVGQRQVPHSSIYSSFTVDAPNLVPSAPPGWDDTIVVSNVSGTGSDAPVSVDEPAFIDFALANAGQGDAGSSFYATLYINNYLLGAWKFTGLQSGWYAAVTDIEHVFFDAGTYTITLICDSENHIIETDETDNQYARQSEIEDSGLVYNEIYRFDRMWPTLQHPWYFNDPEAIAVDNAGYLYVADSGNHCIQKFTSDGEFVTKWGSFGTGDGQFHGPRGIAVDNAGYVYVADSDNHCIQKFTSDGEFVTKWGSFGTGDGQFHGPRGIAVDSAGYLYVADRSNHRIQKFDPDGVFIAKWGTAGSSDGQFQRPHSIAIDTSGYLYVTDSGNHRIQRFDPDGLFMAKWGTAGSSDGQFQEPLGIAVDSNGHICVSDRGNHRIQKFNPDGLFISKWGSFGVGDAQFYWPSGITLDSNGYVYVADRGNHRIQKFTSGEQFISKWGSLGTGDGQFYWPSGVAIDADGYVYVADSGNYRIQKLTSDGLFVGKWVSPAAEQGQYYSWPSGIAVDASGYVYAADSGNHRVQKFTSGGVLVSSWGSFGAGDGQFNSPSAIAVDSSGNVYVADSGNYRIQKFSSDGVFISSWGSVVAGDDQFLPFGIAVDSIGNVYVADSGNGRIQKFTSDGVFVSGWGSFGMEDAKFGSSLGIAVDSNNRIYVADSGTQSIQKFASSGQLVNLWGGAGSGIGQLGNARGVAIDSSGRVFVCELSNHRVQVFSWGTVPSPDEKKNKAIVVAGSGFFTGNTIWNATQMCANYAYRVLSHQGYTKDNIYYLSSDIDLDLDGNGISDDVDANATNNDFQSALTGWAEDAEDLLVYMVGHGEEEAFRMGTNALLQSAEMLQASKLDTWLDEIQETIPGTVVLIYDACRSGSFLPYLSPPIDNERIIATSSSDNQGAIFSTRGTISFSFLFWGHMLNGERFLDSFSNAMNSIGITYAQTAQLDCNGNGNANEAEDIEFAQTIQIGNETVLAGDMPVIGSVSPIQILDEEISAPIYAADVIDADGISRVWAVITPPNYSSGSPDNPVTDLPILDMSPMWNDRYEATYSGFTATGTYNIAIYASDRGRVLSLPFATTVTQTGGTSISPTSASFDWSGGTGSVSVTATSSWSWTATSNDSWLTITSGGSGTGDGTVNYSVSPNSSESPRTATVTIAWNTFTVDQSGVSDSGLWSSAIDLGYGWKYLEWFGTFWVDEASLWIYHNNHGWVYADGEDTSYIWFWTWENDWFWSSDLYYPWIYVYRGGVWTWDIWY